MAAKQKPCSIGPKHKWEFVKNTTLTTVNYGTQGTRAHIRYKGIYKCPCGEHKLGQTQYEEKDGAA